MSQQSEITPSGSMNFGSRKNKKKAQAKQENIQQNLDQNELRSQQAAQKPVNHQKKQQTIDAGKSFIDKFFQGFSQPERANVKADLDDTFPYRLNEFYDMAISVYASEAVDYDHHVDYAKDLNKELLGALSIGTAIKLNKSASEMERQTNFSISALRDVKIKLPRKASVLIDQLGKTDLSNDNHFRLRNQNYAARRHLVRGIYYLFGKEALKDYLRYPDIYSIDDLKQVVDNEELFSGMIDNSTWSLNRLKEIGRDVYNLYTMENLEIWDKGDENTKFLFRLPKIDFDLANIDTVGQLLSNKIFTTFKFNNDALWKMASGLILAIAPINWVREPKKPLKELNSKFNSTVFADVTFLQIMTQCNVWNVNYFFDDATLNDLAIATISRWNTGQVKTFEKFLEIGEIEFSDHGSDAQLIQVDNNKVERKITGIFDTINYRIRGKARSITPLKVSNNNAILGLISKFTKNIKFESNFELNHDKNNSDILNQFLKNDIKTYTR